MKRIISPIIFLLSLFLILSCKTTVSDFVKGISVDPTIKVSEKLEFYGGLPVKADMPEIFYDGREWLSKMTELVENAEDYILISTFLGSFSDNLEDFYTALIKKAEEGVRIYYMMDGTSSYDMTETKEFLSPLYFLRDYGINLLEFGPLSGLRIINPLSLVYRDHRKLFIVDGKVAALGGMNINYISVGAEEGETQRDSMFLFHSPDLIEALIDEFVKNWNDQSIDKIERSSFSVSKEDNKAKEYNAWLFNKGRGSNTSISGLYGTLINSAEKEILLFPYLPLLHSDMKKAVKNAVDRGVQVDFLIPIDLRGYARNGLSYELPDLLKETGINLYVTIQDKESGKILPILHEKMMVVDRKYVVIGSSNFNYRSMDLSYEMALVIESEELAERFIEHAETIIKESGSVLNYDKAKMMKDDGSNPLSALFMYWGG